MITLDREFLDRHFTRIDQSIAMASLFAAYHLDVKAVAALTTSGSTALWMSRLNCGNSDLRTDPGAQGAVEDDALSRSLPAAHEGNAQ